MHIFSNVTFYFVNIYTNTSKEKLTRKHIYKFTPRTQRVFAILCVLSYPLYRIHCDPRYLGFKAYIQNLLPSHL